VLLKCVGSIAIATHPSSTLMMDGWMIIMIHRRVEQVRQLWTQQRRVRKWWW
jgi:hypothetical protein